MRSGVIECKSYQRKKDLVFDGVFVPKFIQLILMLASGGVILDTGLIHIFS